MPKFPKGFGRRKSTANAFEDIADAPAEHSFKVFERPDTGKSFDGGAAFRKTATAPSGRTPLSHLDDDNMFVNIGSNRGSGASNTNTASTTDNSSRLSAASTAPSSADINGRDEWKSPHDKPFSDIPLPPVPKSSSGFSLKNAGRTLSWGRSKPTPPTPNNESPSPTVEETPQQNGRSRAVTTSSYASTATPPKLDDNKDLGLSLGGDFSDMFSGFGKRKSVVMDVEANRAMSQSPDTFPSGPANRSYSSNRLNPPSALNIDKNREVEASPYSWSSQHSRDGLMSSASPPPFAPRNETPPPPPVPQHTSPVSYARQRPGGLANTGLRRSSAVMEPKRQSTLEYGESVDEDARLLRESVSASRQLNDPGQRARDSWLMPSTSSYKVDDSTLSSWRTPSTETTPRAKRTEPKLDEDNMFDTQVAAAASLANRYQTNPPSPPTRNAAPQNKVMTPAQFERYRQDQERLKSIGQSKDQDEDEEEETYDDDEDDAEKAKQAAKQRRKQEAHMAVYRQQMMKVTGEAPPAAARPSMFPSQSSPNLAPSGKSSEEVSEEDEEVPLAILQAHGFPSKTKPPMRSVGSNPNLRSSAGSIAGGVVGTGGNLPVFARNLPQDPYFGASVVNPMNRESLAFGGGAGSVTGAPSRGLPPGGLVGVIATEERSRAMRRGSPNMQGDFGPAQPPMMGMQPPMGGSMYNGMGGGMPMGPMGPMGQMNPMMLTPGDQAQIQMTQQMQQFMQMQMQFMQMMTGQGGQQNGHMPSPSMAEMPRPGSAHSLRPPVPQHQRAMTMLEPNAAPWMQNKPGSLYAPSIHAQGNGYAPSIAPSERSNIGLPGRYRPVSQMPVNKENNGRTSSMSGALQNWENKNTTPTIKPVQRSGNASDEDDEEGWEEMAKKRQQKKSIWRRKKGGDNSLSAMINFD